MSSLITAARNATQNAYGLGINKKKDQETLTWLLSKAIFMYGEVDAKVSDIVNINNNLTWILE